jgi:hypothetical protein
VSDLLGHYRIDGVPVGKVSVTARLPQVHEEAGQNDVEILAGVVKKIDLTLKYSATAADAGMARKGHDGGAPQPIIH